MASFGEVEPGVCSTAGRGTGGRPSRRPLARGRGAAHSVFLDGEIDWGAFGVWLTMLLQSRGDDLLRVKGLLNVGGAGPSS